MAQIPVPTKVCSTNLRGIAVEDDVICGGKPRWLVRSIPGRHIPTHILPVKGQREETQAFIGSGTTEKVGECGTFFTSCFLRSQTLEFAV